MAHAAVNPEAFCIDLSDAEEELCRQYGHAKLYLALTELLLLLGVLAALTFTGGAAVLDAYARVPGAPAWTHDLIFLILVGLVARLALFPLQLFNEHWLDRRYGVSCQSLPSWAWEWFCRSAAFGLAVVVTLFPVVETLRWWPLLVLPWCAAFLLVRPLFYNLIYYPLLSWFYPVRFLRKESFNLPGIGQRTLPVYEVQVSHKTRRANAAIRLRGDRSAVYITDTLARECCSAEERVVMAHEFGHLYDQLHLETHTRAGVAQAYRKLMLGTAQLAAGIASLTLLHLLAPALHLRPEWHLHTFPLLAALTLALAHLFSPFLCAEARRDEQDADEYALSITGDVESYVSVMRKLRRLNLEESTFHFLSRFLFDTHPSYRERVHLAMHHRRRVHHRRKGRTWRGWKQIQHHGRR